MSLRGSLFRINNRFLPDQIVGFLAPSALNVNVQSVRHRRTKHWDPKWKLLRRLKVFKVDLPNFNEKTEDLSEEELRSRFKEKGLVPPRPWKETQYFISCTGSVFEPYIPPEGDGKVSPITSEGAKQGLRFLEKKTKSMLSIRKIRQFDEDFDAPEFCKEATEIYIKMHEHMAAKDKEGLVKYVTERAYPQVIHNIDNKTLVWKYLKNVELPRIAHARHTSIVTEDNMFAQVTVRFHTQQILAIYDRFGRLMHGSDIVAKDVLEYVVFEKHLSNQYGIWRIHEKIIPDWMPPKEPSRQTSKRPIENIVDETVVPHDPPPAEVKAEKSAP